MHVSPSPPILASNATARARPIRASNLVDSRELALLSVLLVAYLLSYAYSVSQVFILMNVAGPAALTGILVLGAWWRIARDPLSLWTPLFWFRVASSAYYGLGALTPYIANEVTINEIRGLYSCSETEVLKVGLINVSCIFVVLGTTAFASLFHASRQTTRARENTVLLSRTVRYAAIFLITGGIARYLIVLPFSLGLVSVVPGILMPLAKCYVIGLFLLILVGLRGNRSALILSAALVLIDSRSDC
jgi:hypothetical protein